MDWSLELNSDSTERSYHLEGHRGKKFCFVKLSDIKLSSEDAVGLVIIYDSAERKALHTLYWYNNRVVCFAKLNEITFASSSWDKTIKI